MSTPSLDPMTCSQLAVLEGSSPGILRRLVESFIARQSRAVADADRMLQAGNTQGLRMMAHSLKGSAASLGASALALLAGRIEHAAGHDQLEVCEQLLRGLPDEFDAAVIALRAWVDG